MSRRRPIFVVAIVLCLFAAITLLEWLRFTGFARLEHLFRDSLAQAGRKTPANPDLVFLAIDSDSVGLDETDLEQMFDLTKADAIESRALHLMTQRWPWPREVYALVLSRLVDSGAKVVLFDLTFPTETDGDQPFREALNRYRDHVVVGSNFISATSRGFTSSAATHSRPPESLIPQTMPMDDRVAFTNFWPDNDEIVRRAQYRVTFEQVQGTESSQDSEEFLSLAGRGLIKAGFAEAVPSGTDDHLFRFTAAPHLGFPPRSLFEIFVPEYWKRNYGSGEFFRNKIVVIGAHGNWQHDEHPTPLGSMPGPEVHLNAINAALHREFIRETSFGWLLLFTAGAALLAAAPTLLVRSAWLRVLALLFLNVAGVFAAIIAFNKLSMFVPGTAPGLQLNLSVLLGLILDIGVERVEKTRIRRTLERYVSKNVVRELLDHPQAYTDSLGGVVKPVSILFSDIRGYSIVSARTNPHALVKQLNEYLTAMVDCVFRYGGTLDKFVGDAVMAVWGNARSEGVAADATNAVRAAVAMRETLARLNQDWEARGLPQLRTGIAVNHGPVVAGNIGSPQRMEFTIVGEAVNTSWHLQELTKELGRDLLIGERAAELLDDFQLESLGFANIRDQSRIEVFTIASEPQGGAGTVQTEVSATQHLVPA